MDASRHVSRGAGQSAVAAAAYRSGEKLYDERAQETHDYTRRFGVVASGIEMPARGGPTWTREQLWNEAEAAERRKDSRTARKVEMALPAEMTAEQRQDVARAWAGEIATRYDVAVDWAIHLPDKEGDQRNHHVHLMMTTREIGPEGFRGKAALELSNTDQKKCGMAVGDDAIYALREVLAERLNAVAERHGLDLHADPRSYAERGIDLTPTKHIGVHAVAMDRRGLEPERVEDHAEIRRDNAARIMARPELVLEALTQREAVFTRHDMARELHQHLDDPEQFRTALAQLDASRELVRLSEGDRWEPARFSTRDMIAAEARMMAAADVLAATPGHDVSPARVEAALSRHERLSEEQRAAVAHIVGPGQIAAIAGAAGAGKSASLAAAREAWEAEGYRVRGAALAGKAAEALQASAGIESRTLHALEYGWRNGRDVLASRDVLVIDEAGMVGSRQMGRVLEVAQAAGAKVVLVGDARQLQPIEAGAAFRAVAEQIGVAEIETIRRQREPWAREASQAFAAGAVAVGLAAYAERGHVRLVEDREAAKAAIARDSVAAERAGGTSLILAHTNQDVLDLNAQVRAERQRAGALAAEAPYQTARGERSFATGDRLVFLKNDRDLGVKNGTLATVEHAENGTLIARLDTENEVGTARHVTVEQDAYAYIDHGYAVTLHKAQGATVDRTFVLASGGMDRHLAYVGMTRHRETATLYAGRDDFKDEAALSRRLSRARPKVSTLDFAERRGFETEKAWAENARAWLDRGRERLSEAWERAEQVFAAVRDRAEALRARFAAAEQPMSKEERMQDLQKTFRPKPKETSSDRREQLREQFGEEKPTKVASESEAHRQALREAFKEGEAARSDRKTTPDQVRQAMQERDKPAAERRQTKDRGHENER
ncbi:Ti-type conjugative transfer relaxase TraA [Acidisoma sp. S159]|uniref:Ti-type conjugative transfer relaxase TraA n=1 Tax=Acidisoma sp. S159 TaxID=1747225 RepID=UPI00131BF2AF|nr:Ti-type conjugative transfer relaxase TraA [Acidisoma sp. S159]